MSLQASDQGLAMVDRARSRKGWTKTRTLEWWQQAHTSQATLRCFWRQQKGYCDRNLAELLELVRSQWREQYA